MRFWKKTYLLTLILFLVCMNAGVLSLTVYTYGKTVEAAETAAKAEQYYIAVSFQRDYEALTETGSGLTGISVLMQSYGRHYGKQGLQLAFAEEGKELYTSFRGSYTIGQEQLLHKQLEGKRHILISTPICSGKYTFVFAKDVSDLDMEFGSLMLTYAVTAAGVSLVLAVVLYFLLKTLSAPLERLRKTTELIQKGDYTVTAQETGNDEFTLLARSFNAMLAKLNQQMNALELDAQKKQLLVDNLAHELRTPLTSIQGYGEFLEKAAASEEKRIDAARYILSESRRLQKISETLLDSALIRGNPPEMQALDAAPILADTARRLQDKAEKAGVTLALQAEALPVRGNETLLSMLFYNLTDNAIKACLPGGRVALSCSGHGVCIADNGKGMTAEQLLHITEPFYRTDRSRSREGGGAGLGLALCQQIAASHAATLRFESEKGLGTKVFVDFTA